MKLTELKLIHKGKYLSYYIARYINNDGGIKDYEFISRDPNLTIETFGNNKVAGVGLVALSKDKDKVLLQAEFRPATKHFVYNFPAGLIDEGETPKTAAIRELKEETGLDVIEIIDELPPSYASQGTSDELMSLVICTVEGEIKDSIFVNEEIHAKWFSKDEVRQLLKDKALMSVRTQMFLYMWVNN